MRRAQGRVSLLATLGATAALVMTTLGPALPAVADTRPPAGTPATVSADALPTWQINGVVWSQVVVRNTVYVTGSFTKARPPGVPAGGAGEVNALNIFAFDITSGNRVSTFNHSLNAQGRVLAAAPDGSRVYVGGDFTAVDGAIRGHVAAFNTTTGALESFAPNLNGQVRALAVGGSTVFIGGNYQTVGGVARKSLSSVSPTGSLLPWKPTVDNGYVWSMVLSPDRTRVIVGGSFTTLNAQAASGMGALNASTGAGVSWAANQTIRNGGSKSAITALRTDGQQIYGAGYAFGTGNFEGTFAANPLTGAITVVNDCHGDTYDVLPVGQVLYSVSHAHDCTWIGSFPDTSPRSRWQYAMAQTILPSTVNKGPDNYGWNYNGLPASAVLHWFPQLSMGSYTGQYQAAWSLAGNGTYVVLGGEFPRVNGVAQQSLTRMAVSTVAPNRSGPTYATKPDRPVPATTAAPSGSGAVRVTFGTAWDYDNATLTYDLFRDGGGTPIYSRTIRTNFWTLPTGSYLDSGLPRGSTHTYQVRIRDPFGNTVWSPKSSNGASAAPQRNTQNDFTGDGRADRAVFRPSTGQWFVQGQSTVVYGQSGDIPVPADFTGDGRADRAVFRPSTGQWFVQGQSTVVYGQSGDIPVPADFTGDGRADRAVFRPSTGQWFVQGQSTVVYGQSGDIPVPADFTGDGRADRAVFRPSTGQWFVQGQSTVVYGQSGDIPVPADFTGDGRADRAVFRPSTGQWFVQGQSTVVYGQGGDIPVPADFTGDGRADRAVFRPSTGQWFVQGQSTVVYGQNGDIPV